MNKTIKYIYVYLFLFMVSMQCAFSQSGTTLTDISAKIYNEAAEPITNVYVFAQKAKTNAFSDENGNFTISTLESDIVIIDVPGYERQVLVVDLGKTEKESIKLIQKNQVQVNSKQEIVFGQLDFDRLTGSVASISGKELSDVPTIFVEEAIEGRLAGITSKTYNYAPGEESMGINLWGKGISSYLIDGVPGVLGETPEEIDRIYIGKDLSSTSLLAGSANNGVLIAKTKIGVPNDNQFSIKFNYGIRSAAFMPEMMDAVSYAKFMNRAMENDGLSPAYSDEAIAAYQSGSDPIRYPNYNYQEELLNSMASYNNLAVNLSGGDSRAVYSTHIGLYTAEGLEKGVGRDYLRTRVRSNLLLNLGDYGKLDVAVGGVFSTLEKPNYNSSEPNIFEVASTYPSNAVPLELSDTSYGYSSEYTTNALMQITDKGLSESFTRNGFAKLGFMLDLDNLLTGLTFDAKININLLSNSNRTTSHNANLFEPIFAKTNEGVDTTIYIVHDFKQPSDDWVHQSDNIFRDMFVKSGFGYNRSFGENHQVSANLIINSRLITGSSLEQEERWLKYGGRVNYFFKKRYVIDGSYMKTGSQTLSNDKKFAGNYHVGAAWVASQEHFLKNVSWLSYLKARVSYGKTAKMFGYINNDPGTYYINQTLYSKTNSYSFGIVNNSNSINGYTRSFTGSPDIDWQYTNILNAGIDMQFLKGKLRSSVNVFNVNDYNTIQMPYNKYAILNYADSTEYKYLAYENLGDVTRQGMDFQLSYSDKLGDFMYMIDANIMYMKSVVNEGNYLNYPESNRNRIGASSDNIMGLEAIGLFEDDTDIANSPKQLFGDVKPGDIKYADKNDDGIIDEKDIHSIGNAPRMFYGLNVILNYKSFTLGIHGNGKLGGNIINSKHWSKGSDNYLASAADLYSSGDLPRSTVLGGQNNNRYSSYWLEKGGYFSLSSLNLAYRLPHRLSSQIAVENLSFFISGKNLFVISAVDEVYAPSINAGYTSYPALRAFELGVEVTF